MVEILEGEALSKYLLQKYSKKPSGWNFTLFPSKQEGYGALVSGPEETWQLKIDSIYRPNPLMLGSKSEHSKKQLSNVSYGYRRLDPKTIFELLRSENPSSSTIEKLLAPIVPEAPIAGQPYAEGPFVMSDRKTAGITDAQKDLDDKLSLELRKLVRNRYSSYG